MVKCPTRNFLLVGVRSFDCIDFNFGSKFWFGTGGGLAVNAATLREELLERLSVGRGSLERERDSEPECVLLWSSALEHWDMLKLDKVPRCLYTGFWVFVSGPIDITFSRQLGRFSSTRIVSLFDILFWEKYSSPYLVPSSCVFLFFRQRVFLFFVK